MPVKVKQKKEFAKHPLKWLLRTMNAVEENISPTGHKSCRISSKDFFLF